MALMMPPISLLFCSGHSEGTTTGPMGDLGGRRERTTSLRKSRMGWSAPDRARRSPSYLACSSPAIGTPVADPCSGLAFSRARSQTGGENNSVKPFESFLAPSGLG